VTYAVTYTMFRVSFRALMRAFIFCLKLSVLLHLAKALQIKWVHTQTDNVQLYSEATGDPKCPAIVFVHGFAQAGLAFDHQFYDHDLTSRFYLVRYDMRGHGWSSAPDSLDAYNSGTKWGQDLQSVIQAWDLKNVSLVGWSYGGTVISEYVRVAGQENVANMIYVDASTSIGIPGPSILNPNYTAIFPTFVSTDYETRMQGFKKFIAMITKEPLSQDTYMKALGWMLATKPVCSQGMRERVSNNTQALKNLRKPTLIIQGDDDRIQLPIDAQMTLQLISSSKLVVLENAGHACFIDQPQAFNQQISQFISH
jgi:non-heme chloroperoxidase